MHSNLSQLKGASLWRRRDAGEAGKVRFAAAHACMRQMCKLTGYKNLGELSCRDLVTHCWIVAPHKESWV